MSKSCTRCLITQDESEFSNISAICKKCDRTRAKAYYAANKGGVKARTAEYRKRNPDKHQTYCKKHYESNKASYRQRDMAAQIRRRNQTPSWLSKAHIAEMEGMYMFCQLFSGYQVDHIVPIRGETVSGLHVPWNLQVLTRSKNAQKSNTFNPSIYPEQGICTYMENSI